MHDEKSRRTPFGPPFYKIGFKKGFPLRHSTIATVVFATVAFLSSALDVVACDGCGCRGGPGYRLPSGNCASWAQHEKHKASGDFPPGSQCEHPQGCRLETPQGVKLLGAGELK